MDIQPFFDADTATFTYVVSDPASKQCAVIDPVLDYDIHSGKMTTVSADRVARHVVESKLELIWLLETHIHADHLTAAHYLKQKLGGQIGIGEGIKTVLGFWAPLLNTAKDTPLDGSLFDRLFRDGETFRIGTIEATVMLTPGHTPACASYCMGDAAFVGDALFMPYVGTARADFPGGDAKTLYRSIRRLLSLPANTRLYAGHDYPPPDQTARCMATVAEQKAQNTMVRDGITEEEYIALRHAKDQGKPVPKLLFPAIQVNLRAGRLSEPESNGLQYLKIPLNALS